MNFMSINLKLYMHLQGTIIMLLGHCDSYMRWTIIECIMYTHTNYALKIDLSVLLLASIFNCNQS